LPAGSKLVVTAHYDNSSKNVHLLHPHGHGGDPGHAPGTEEEVYFREMNQSWDEMFTPFVQYATDGEETALSVVEVVGCLEPERSDIWTLTKASEPGVSTTQTTSAEAVKAAADKPLGKRRNRLLGVGVDVFHPLSEEGQKVEVKGVLIQTSDESRINVTSLQMAGAGCF
jgi:hypothetical protein